ncbi:MAG TPA: FG-GAP-like repeat-containing protein, partial [Nannocystaceae bacterium]|nr:FG-GAP-like repeat-containing protein [Nannocystaceae bacterium]
MACGDGGDAREDASASGDTGIGASATATVGDGTLGDATLDDGADGTAGCPAEQACGEDMCCAAGEVCVDDACVVDCGGADPCGVDQICCESDQICFIGSCIVPGSACQGLQCATNTESECNDGEVCDSELGFCVPDFANPDCAFHPDSEMFDPIPRFTWGLRATRACDLGCQTEEVCMNDVCTPTWTHVSIAADDFPEYHQVVMTPMVADLDGDCVPEIVFNSYHNSEYQTDGILRAIRGDTGAKVWTLGDQAYRTDPGAHPAIGDLDGDGRPEIVAPGEGANLIAVAWDGAPLWVSDNYGFGGDKSGSPSIANFDGQGPPEIAFGRAVWDSTGVKLFEAGNGSTGSSDAFGPIPCVADLDGDDRPELIAGDTAHTFTGTVGVDFAGQQMWTAQPGDGWCGVADFDLDGMPEVALVSAGTIYVLDGQTGATLSSIPIPLGGAGGPPNIADFDGDGTPDIGTAANDRYVVVQFDGVASMSQLWYADTKDASSERTGSSVFDFDGDGRNEVIYGDEWYLRIYPGTEPDCAVAGPLCDGVMTDEEILYIDINSSRTRSENPVVADVDGDFKAEIVVSTNNESSQGAIGDAGIEVLEDRSDN